MAQRTQYTVLGLPGQIRSFSAKTELVALIPDYKFVINPITGQLDKVVNNISVLKTNWKDGSILFADSNDVVEENTTLRYDKVNNRLLVDSYVIDKASGRGIKVDLVTPTFGFADITGDQFSKNTGATKPTLAVYNGAIKSWQFGVGDEAHMSYHLPHDYVKGSDIFLHVHWSHTGTLVTGGTITFKATSIYSKGHNQAPFTGTPKVGTFTGDASTVQYQHILSEVLYSASSPTGIQIDTDDLEPDGIIEITLEVDVNGITVSGGGVPDPFIHFIDLHYQTNGIIGTKAKIPDFYT